MASDHERGCQGREYTCTCGYDDSVADRITELEAENVRLRVVARWAGHDDGCNMMSSWREDKPCDCGYLDAIKAWRDQTRQPQE
jgi:hypothetical protein